MLFLDKLSVAMHCRYIMPSPAEGRTEWYHSEFLRLRRSVQPSQMWVRVRIEFVARINRCTPNKETISFHCCPVGMNLISPRHAGVFDFFHATSNFSWVVIHFSFLPQRPCMAPPRPSTTQQDMHTLLIASRSLDPFDVGTWNILR